VGRHRAAGGRPDGCRAGVGGGVLPDASRHQVEPVPRRGHRGGGARGADGDRSVRRGLLRAAARDAGCAGGCAAGRGRCCGSRRGASTGRRTTPPRCCARSPPPTAFPACSTRCSTCRASSTTRTPPRSPRAAPGTVVARGGHAVLRTTRDGAVWIGHCRRADADGALKLPVALAFPREWRQLPPTDGPAEVRYDEHGPVGVLHFPFYNGAMSTRSARNCSSRIARRWRGRRGCWCSPAGRSSSATAST